MGLLDWRKRKLMASAAEHLEPGEEIRAMVVTQTGQSAMKSATGAAVMRPSLSQGAREYAASQATGDRMRAGEAADDLDLDKGAVHAIVVTDLHVYSFFVPGFGDIAGTRQKLPLATAAAELDGKVLRVGGVEYHGLLFAGKDARAVAEHALGAPFM